MPRTCLIVPPSPLADSAALGRLWTALKSSFGTKPDLQLLFCDEPKDGLAGSIAAELDRLGLAARNLADFPLPFDCALLPDLETQTRAWRLASALEALGIEVALFLGDPGSAVTAIQRRRCGQSLAHCAFVLLCGEPAELARREDGRFPVEGRNAIAGDFLERRALSLADGLVFEGKDTEDSLKALGWTLAPCLEKGAQDALPWAAIQSLRPSEEASPALPSVSVCVPYFEQPAFLAQALEDILAQSRPPEEVIVIDDGSRTQEAQEAFQACAKRFEQPGWHFVRQENAGPAAARNHAARLATSETLLFCDADNRFQPHMALSLARALVRTKADAVTSAFRGFYDKSSGQETPPDYIYAPLGPCLELSVIENVLGDTNALVRRDVFLELGGFASRTNLEDWRLWMHYLRQGRCVETVPEVLFHYRLALSSRARSKTELSNAEGVMAPLLTEAGPLWSRLWPHLVGMARNTEAGRLRSELCSAKEDAQKLRAFIAEKSALVEERQRLTDQHVRNLEGMIAAHLKRIAELETQCSQLETELQARTSKHVAEKAHQHTLLMDREARLAAIESTRSWRFTRPLRWLARKLGL
jgi:hypothetical protein